jgi:WD40 repeat protein
MVVGFGNGKKVKGKSHQKEGCFSIINFENLKVVSEKKDSNDAISVIKFSPSGKVLAVASDDCCIYLYSPEENFLLKNIIRSHEAPVVNLDYLIEIAALVSVDLSMKVCFSSLPLGLPLQSFESLGEDYLDFSNIFSTFCRGLWLLQHDSKLLKKAAKAKNFPLLAGGNNAGEVYIMNFPSYGFSGFATSKGHVGEISDLKWCSSGHSFLTTGKDDCVVLQWKIAHRSDHNAKHLQTENVVIPASFPTIYENDDSLPWHRQLIPSEVTEKRQVRELSFSVQFVGGISGRRKSTMYNMNGECVYFSGNFACIFDTHSNLQKFYSEHQREITVLSLNKQRTVAATGTEAGELHVWDALTGKSLKKFAEVVVGNVLDACFSASSHLLICLSSDSYHSLLVFCSPSACWTDGNYFVSSCVTPSQSLTWCLFLDTREYPIIVGGESSIYLFKVVNASVTKKVLPIDPTSKSTVTCSMGTSLCLSEFGVLLEYFLCGTSDGFIFIVDETKVCQKVSAHHSSLIDLCLLEISDSQVASFAADSIKIWSIQFQPIRTIDINKLCLLQEIPPSLGRSMCFRKENGCFLVHCSNGYLLEFSFDLLSLTEICEGHAAGRLLAADFNPRTSSEFVTAGDDGYVRLWNWETHCCTQRKLLAYSCSVLKYGDEALLIGGSGNPHSSIKNPKIGELFDLRICHL